MVEDASTNGLMQIGQVKVGSFGTTFSGSGSGFMIALLCNVFNDSELELEGKKNFSGEKITLETCSGNAKTTAC